MRRIIERCAGLDVHKASITACVKTGGEAGVPHQEIREFSATTRGLLQLRSQALGRLNEVATVTEYDVDQEGNYRYRIWEWR